MLYQRTCIECPFKDRCENEKKLDIWENKLGIPDWCPTPSVYDELKMVPVERIILKRKELVEKLDKNRTDIDLVKQLRIQINILTWVIGDGLR